MRSKADVTQTSLIYRMEPKIKTKKERETRNKLEMWANAQPDGRPAEYRWRPLLNAAKFG